MASNVALPDLLAQQLAFFRYTGTRESDLQAHVSRVLTYHGHTYVAEHIANPQCRFDFWLPDHGIVIETKTRRNPSALLRQIARYAVLPTVRTIIVVATLCPRLPQSFAGRRIVPVSLWKTAL